MFQYRVKVRARTYLWGGADITEGFYESALLVLRVDEIGESIAITKHNVAFNRTKDVPVGILKRGEALTINLRELSGVWAEIVGQGQPAVLDSFVDCMIISR